jgi:hypothetical protein
MSKDAQIDDESRRSFVKKAAYVTPAIITLEAMPAFASYGSGNDKDKDKDKDYGWEKNEGKDKEEKDKEEKDKEKDKD